MTLGSENIKNAIYTEFNIMFYRIQNFLGIDHEKYESHADEFWTNGEEIHFDSMADSICTSLTEIIEKENGDLKIGPSKCQEIIQNNNQAQTKSISSGFGLDSQKVQDIVVELTNAIEAKLSAKLSEEVRLNIGSIIKPVVNSYADFEKMHMQNSSIYKM